MEVRHISREDIVSSEPIAPQAVAHINIFEVGGVERCQLSCRNWRPTMSRYKDRKELKKNTNSHGPNHGRAFNFHQLENSANRGCMSCALFKSLFRTVLTNRGCNPEIAVFEWLGYAFLLQLTYDNKSHKLQLFSPVGVWSEEPVNQDIKAEGDGLSNAITGSKMKITYMRSGHVLPGDTSSFVSMERTREMVNRCEKEHATCGPGRQEILPRRLIDLSPLDHGVDGVKLIDFADSTDARGTYACLSHCWGKDPMPVTTTKKNIHDNLKLIALSLLPATFRDAITISRSLELRYLWIDSLCIIQDSAEDWEVESGKMASIYQNSFITIAATSSSDFRGGCFSKGDGDMCFQVKYGSILDAIIAVRGEVVGDFSQLYPLLTRGWVYQERMLSRRLLYCNQDELQLECREDRVCECGNIKLMRPDVSKQERLGAKSKYQRPGSHLVSVPWQTAVKIYSMLHLTKSSDKLPAISGCAKDMRSSERGRYLGGVWENTLVEDLLWIADGHATYPRPVEWRAPSWSWASVDTPAGVKFLSGGLGNAAGGGIASMEAFQKKVLEIRCEPKGLDDTGEVDPASAYIRLKSSLGEGHIRRMCYSCLQAKTGGGMKKEKHILETDPFFERWKDEHHSPCRFAVDGMERRGSEIALHPDFSYTETTFDYSVADDMGHCRLAPVSLLKVIEVEAYRKGTVTAFFLVLKDVEGSHRGIYGRVALLSIGFPSRDLLKDWFEQVFKPRLGSETVITIV